MVHLQPLDRMRLQRGVEHLHSLGARATAEALAEVAGRIGGLPVILAVLGEFSTVTPHKLRTTGGDCFSSRPLRQAPP